MRRNTEDKSEKSKHIYTLSVKRGWMAQAIVLEPRKQELVVRVLLSPSTKYLGALQSFADQWLLFCIGGSASLLMSFL